THLSAREGATAGTEPDLLDDHGQPLAVGRGPQRTNGPGVAVLPSGRRIAWQGDFTDLLALNQVVHEALRVNEPLRSGITATADQQGLAVHGEGHAVGALHSGEAPNFLSGRHLPEHEVAGIAGEQDRAFAVGRKSDIGNLEWLAQPVRPGELG